MALIPSDPEQKAKFEQRAVMALLGIFGIVFFFGPMRGMAFLGNLLPKSASAGAVAGAGVNMSRPLSEMVQSYQQRSDPEYQLKVADASSDSASPAAAPNYTAIDLRNPFESLLPEPPSAPVQTAQELTPPEPPKPKITPPSDLIIEGLIWGGPRPQVLIKGQVYYIGDRVGGGVITAIARGGITMDFEGTAVQFSTIANAGRRSLSRSAQWR
ncbi:MAG: hypothetical protein HY352_05860 [Candidatus Omnitrophica bacterium]|nr:hypothetical protein [Candidatus Omnitrophota bacterium]